jgi:putative chitinase
MITPAQLRAAQLDAKQAQTRNPGVWCRAFSQMVDEFDLAPPHRLAMWLAQCSYESSGFNMLREGLSYRTVEQLRKVFPHEFPTDDSAQRYVMNPNGLGNFIYANKLGNGDVASNDGFKYRGGGLIQITGRANYEAAGKAIGRDLVNRPNDIIIEIVAARTAGYFWTLKDLNAAADAGDFDHTTRAINGAGMKGAQERRQLWLAFKAQLGVTEAVAA